MPLPYCEILIESLTMTFTESFEFGGNKPPLSA